MLVSGFMGAGDSTAANSDLPATTVAMAAQSQDESSFNNKNSGLDEVVRQFNSDKPLMAEISYCESRFRQYAKDGSSLRGVVNSDDVGLFQINEFYHLERAKKLGFDIHTVEGNMAYARVLFDDQGPSPWISSSPCWSKTVAYKDYIATKKALIASK